MKVGVACDHAGYPLKAAILARIAEEGHEPLDLGVFSPAPADYPDVARSLAEGILQGRFPRGVLICGSGVGVSVAANKFPGVRAAVCHDAYSAHQGVEHDDMNALTLGARVIGVALAQELVSAFLRARFSGEERHLRRLQKVVAIEASFVGSTEKGAPQARD
jgi:ribose 5-phosphate isomerase B